MVSKINYFSISKQGKKSEHNEDYVAIPSPKTSIESLEQNGYFFVLCDGIAGAKAGETASRICAKTLFENYYQFPLLDDFQLHILSTITSINDKIWGIANEFPQYSGMGTTLVSLLLKNNYAFLNSVGDSRAYIWNQKKLTQITEDQSPAWKSYKQGDITKDEILKCKYKNIISEAIGIKPEPEILSYHLNLNEKFIFLLCSDGLTDVCFDSEIEEIISATDSLQNGANTLYNLAIENKSIDDISIILISNYLY
jgi:protein phosphatase